MTKCLPDLPRYLRQRGDEWQGADHPDGPWRSIPAPQSGLLWAATEPAVPEGREPASVTPEPTGQPLSPAAQAVLNAWLSSERGQRMLGDPACLAAALRAAADQMIGERCQNESERRIYDRLRRFAAELEGFNG